MATSFLASKDLTHPSVSLHLTKDNYLDLYGAGKTAAYVNKLHRVNGELRANKERNVIMSPYVPHYSLADTELEIYTASLRHADDIEEFLSP